MFSHSDLNPTWLHRWVSVLAVGFMFSASTLRAYVTFQDDELLGKVMLLMGLWLLLLVGEAFLGRRLSWSTAIFLAFEAGIILYLLLVCKQDFFAFLFGLIGMQAMQRYSPRIVVGLVVLFAVLVFLIFLLRIPWLPALALTLIYTSLGGFMAAYVWSIRQAEAEQKPQQALVAELQAANLRLEALARQQEELTAGRERQRLARELHDSVTQTIFSMTLTTQSALLMLAGNRGQVAGQLDRLDQLAGSALAEMQVLISRLAPQAAPGEGFINMLQRHIEERRRLEDLEVTLEVEGDQPLEPAEEARLFRIAQEALNNIVKHARVSQVVMRLHLSEPLWMEIEDHGAGFDLQAATGGGRMGLAGMRERAAEIGWNLQVDSSPGGGTRIRIEKSPRGEARA